MIKTIARLVFYYQLLSSGKERDLIRTVDWFIKIGGLEKSGILLERTVRVRAGN